MSSNFLNHPEYISLKEASELSGYHADHVGRLIRRGLLYGKRTPRGWMTTRTALAHYARGKVELAKLSPILASAEPFEAPGVERADLNLDGTPVPQPSGGIEPQDVQDQPTQIIPPKENVGVVAQSVTEVRRAKTGVSLFSRIALLVGAPVVGVGLALGILVVLGQSSAADVIGTFANRVLDAFDGADAPQPVADGNETALEKIARTLDELGANVEELAGRESETIIKEVSQTTNEITQEVTNITQENVVRDVSDSEIAAAVEKAISEGITVSGTSDFSGANVDRLSVENGLAVSGTISAATFKGGGLIVDHAELSGNLTVEGVTDFNGSVTLGDTLSTIAITSSTWNVTEAGVASGFTELTVDNLKMDGNTLSSLTTGGVTISPLAGESVSVALSTTGNFVVNTDDLVVDTGTGNVGIGVTAPGEELTLASTYSLGWDNGAGVADVTLYRSAADTLKTDDFFVVNNNVQVTGNLEVLGITTTDGDVDLGDTVVDTITFVGVVDSNIIPASSSAHDLGSASLRWDNGYFDSVTANTLTGVVVGGATSAEDWTINSDNATPNEELSTLSFETGTGNFNAVMQWNASGDLGRVSGFDNTLLFNYPIAFYSQVSGLNQTFTSGTLFSYSQPLAHAITQSGALTGMSVDFSSNITNATGNQTGIALTLKDGSVSGTATGLSLSGTADYGINLSGATIGTAAIVLPTGTAAAQGIDFGGDTQLYRGAADSLYLASGDSFNLVSGDLTVNTDDLFVQQSTGKVGVGTATPRHQFQSQNGGLIHVFTATDNQQLSFNLYDSAGWKYDTTGTGALFHKSALGLTLYTVASGTANADAAIVAGFHQDNAGEVGIGTSAPDQLLTIDDGSLGFSTGGGASDVVLSRGAANRLDLASGDDFYVVNGNVGIGVAPNASQALRIDRTFTAAATNDGRQLFVLGTITGAVDRNINTVEINGTLVEAASGTHPLISSLRVTAPVITDGAATTTTASSLYINAAPTGASNNYAFFVDAGDTRLDGSLAFNGTALNDSAGDIVGLSKLAFGSLDANAAQRMFVSTDLNIQFDANGFAIINASSADTLTVNASGQVGIPVTGSSAGLLIGGDTQLYRGAANRLDLASGDSLYMTDGTFGIGSVTTLLTRYTAILSRDFSSTTASGSIAQVGIRGTVTATGGTLPVAGLEVTPSGTVINSGSTHSLVSSVYISEPVITLTSGSVTSSASLYIASAATEAENNYALFVDAGEARFNDNVGIGTTNPNYKLEVSSTNTLAKIGGATDTGIFFNRVADTDYFLGFNSTYNGSAVLAKSTSAGFIETTGTNLYIGFDASLTAGNTYTPTKIISINSSGNVGVGVTAPLAKLHTIISSTLATGALFSNSDWASLTTGSGLSIRTGAASGDTYTRLQAFDAGASSPNNLILQADGGSVGIGTTAPQEELHIKTASGNDPRIYLEAADAANFPGINFSFDATQTRRSLIRTGATGTLGTELSFFTKPDSATAITQRMVIDNAGNVGIGTATPGTKLEVSSAVSDIISSPNAYFTDSTALAAGVGGGIAFKGTYTGSTTTTGAGIKALKSNATDGNYGFDLGFYTRTNGSGSLGERMRIDSTGNVGIGTTGPDAKLDVLSTTEQLRLTYADGSAYSSFTTSSGGDLTVAPSGGDSNITGTFDVSGHGAFGGGASISTSIFLNIAETYTDASTSPIGELLTLTANPTADSALQYRGIQGLVTTSGSIQNFTSGYLSGLYGVGRHAGSGTAVDAMGVTAYGEKTGTGALTNAYGVWAKTQNTNATGVLTNAYDVYAVNPAATGTITNAYGLYLESITAGTSLNYSIYSAGGTNYFAGNVGIGAVAPGGVLQVSANYSPSNTNNFYTRVGNGTFSGATAIPGTGYSAFGMLALDSEAIAASSAQVIAEASTLLIEGAPSAGANMTITRPFALNVVAGTSYFGGNVGIGATVPNNKLHIHESTAATPVRLNMTNAVTGSAATDGLAFAVDEVGDAFFIQREAANIKIYTNNTSTSGLIINSSGSIGVNVTPSGRSRLHIGGTQTATSGTAFGIQMDADLTAAANSDVLSQIALTSGTTIAKGAFTGLTYSSLNIDGAAASVTGAGTIDTASSMYIKAPTIGTTNYALWVDTGTTRLDGSLDMSALTSGSAGFGIGIAPSTSISVNVDRVTGNSTRSAEYNFANFENSGFQLTGNISDQRNVVLKGSTFTGDVATRTITNYATLYVAGAGTASTNAAITNNYALWVDAGSTRLDGQIAVADTISASSHTLFNPNFSPDTSTIGSIIRIAGTLNAAVGLDAYTARISPAMVEAASGNHALLAGLAIDTPSVTSGVATVANTASFYIQGASSATVSGANYALWVDAGTSRFDGGVTLDADTTLSGNQVGLGYRRTSGQLELESDQDMAFVLDNDNTYAGSLGFSWYSNGHARTGTQLMSLNDAGQLTIPITGSSAGLLIGGDAQLYRSAANTLKTDDDFVVAGTTGLTFSGVGGQINFTNGETIDNDTDGQITVTTGILDVSSYAPTATSRIVTGNSYEGTSAAYGGSFSRFQSSVSNANSINGIYGNGHAYALGLGNTLAWAKGVYGTAGHNGGTNPGTVTNAASLYAGAVWANGGGVTTTGYGLYVEDQTAATNDFGIAIAGADTAALWISSAVDTTDAANGIAFGLSRDTNLYRSAADTLKTDDALVVGSTLSVGGDVTPSSATVLDTVLTTVDSVTSADTGRNSSIYCVTSTDCKISYFDATNNNLMMADCDDATCSTKTLTTVDSVTSANTGQYSSIYCVTSTDCKIAYYDATNGDLMMADCDDATCSTKTLTTVDSTTAGLYTSIQCISSTDCKIAYQGGGTANLLMADCDDATCSTKTLTTVDSAVNAGYYIDMHCVSATDCKISYQNATDSDLRMADCDNATCSSKTLTTIDSANNTGYFTSIYCISSTDCKISYADNTSEDLRMADCDDSTCATKTLTTVDSTTSASTGYHTSIYCLSSTDCKISYQDVTNTNLMIADCGDATCATKTLTTVDSVTSANTGDQTSIYCISSTDCKITYRDVTNLNLMMANCYTTACTTGVSGYNLGSSVLPFQSIYAGSYYGKSTTISSFDLAEEYYSTDTLEPGEIVSVYIPQEDGVATRDDQVVRTAKAYEEGMVGVVSTEPGITLANWQQQDRTGMYPIALAGRVPVKVSNENGAIKPGDSITSSSIPGVGMKATQPGRVVGIALSSFSPQVSGEDIVTGTVVVFVNASYAVPNEYFETLQQAGGSEASGFFDGFATMIVRVQSLVASFIQTEQIEVTNPYGITVYDTVTGEPYCVVSENGALKSLPGMCTDVSGGAEPQAAPQPDAEPIPASDPVVEPAAEPTPEPAPEPAPASEPVIEMTPTTEPAPEPAV